jgi:hypothetical protein
MSATSPISKPLGFLLDIFDNLFEAAFAESLVE